MKITEEQRKVLDSFSCERLAGKPENMRIVEDFYNSRNPQLEQNLKDKAYEEDENNTTAYYVIKDEEGSVVFYFSLKCGMLYDKIVEADQYQQLRKIYNLLIKKITDKSISEDKKEGFKELLESLRSKKGLTRESLERVFRADEVTIDEIFKGNQRHVGKTYSGVEIVHFCINDGYREKWEALNMPQRLGSIIFWKFIIPQVECLLEIVGCEYIFLFAADLSEDESLVNYYRELGFTDSLVHHVAIPLYDLACKFMHQKTNQLIEKQKRFFENFNPDFSEK